MFSILRLRQGCLYFHSYSNVWVNVLQKGLILSALEGAFITRQRRRQCCKEITQRHFPPAPWSLPLFRMAEISFQPSCPLRFHSGRGEKPKPWKEIIEERNTAHLHLWLHRSLCIQVSEYSRTWAVGKRKSPPLPILWPVQFYISVHHFAYSQRKINIPASQASKTGLLRLCFGGFGHVLPDLKKKVLTSVTKRCGLVIHLEDQAWRSWSGRLGLMGLFRPKWFYESMS